MQAQTLYIDANTGAARDKTTGSVLPQLIAILGTTLQLKFGFTVNGTPGVIANLDGNPRVSAKLSTALSSTTSLLPDGAWTAEGSDATKRYIWTVLADSEQLRTALGQSAFIDLVLGVEWELSTGDDNPRKSQFFTLRVANSPCRTGDGAPDVASDQAWLWLKDRIEGSENVTLEYDEVEKVISIVVDVPDVGVTDGDKGDIIVASSGSVWTIQDGAVTTAKLADDSVTADKIAAGTITATELANDSVGSAQIQGGAVGTGGLATGAVTEGKLADASVTAGKVASNAVTTVKILDANVTTAKLADASVTAVKLATDAVTTVKLLDANVTTAKLANDAVTYAKIQPVTASKLLGRRSGSGGDVEEITISTGLSMDASGNLTASGSGGGAAPLVNAIVYVDLTGTDPGAGVGTGTAMSDFKQAYDEAVSYVGAHVGAQVTIMVAPGVYDATNVSLSSDAVLIIGSGVAVTIINIENEGVALNKIYGRDFMLNLDCTVDNGTDGAAASEGSPDAQSGSDGADISGCVMGRGGFIGLNTLSITSGTGGNASAPYDDGMSTRDGANGGNAGDLIFVISAVERMSGDWSLISGGAGGASSGLNGGVDGSNGTEESVIRLANVRNHAVPVAANYINVSSAAGVYALDCQLGIINEGTWSANGCRYISQLAGTITDGGGAPNYVYLSGI